MGKRKLAVAVLAGLAVTAMTFGLAACGGGGGGGNSMVKPGGGGSTPSTPPSSSPSSSSPPTSSPPTSAPPTSAPPSSSPPTPYDAHNNQLIPTGALDAQKAGFTGAGIKVGVLDSGVDPTDPALNASDATHRNKVVWFKSYDSSVTDPTAPNDNFGHGTVTAQLIAGDPYSNSADKVQFNGGVAPGADLYVAQACYGYGTSGGEACHPTAQVYNDLIAQGVKVISSAFSDSGDVTQYAGGAANATAASTYALLHPVAQAGVLQIFGTGESGKVANPGIDAGLPYLFPDMQPYIIAVTVVALDANGKPTGLYTDGNGATPCGVAAQWCLSAPAEVYTVPANPAFNTGHSVGTSSGTAIVTGVAAQVWQAFPWMTAANMSDTLLTTATPISGCPASQCGWGMVNAAKAVKGPAQFAFGNFDANVPSGTTSIFANDISGAGSLTLSGPGYLVLAGNDTYSGGTTISAGTLQLGAGGTTGSIVSDTVTNSGALVFDQSGSMTYGGAILGTGSVTQAGNGTLTLTGTSTYSGGTNIDSGVLQVSNDGNLGLPSGDVVIDNGTLQAGASFTLSHGIDIENTAHIDTNGHALTLTGPIGWIGQGTLSKEGIGILTIASMGPDPYQLVNVNAGTLAISPSWSYGGMLYVHAGFVSIASGAIFDVSQAGGEPKVTGLNGSGTIALGGQRLNLESGNESWTFGGVIADGGIGGGSGGGLLMNEPSVTGTLTGVNTYTGETDILAGTLALAGHASIADSSGASIDSGGALDISATTSGATVKDLWGSGAVALGARTLTVSGATGILDGGFNGAISGTGGLELSGGTLLLGGANTYTGITTIDAGATLQLGDNVGDASIAGNVSDNGALVFDENNDLTYGGVISGSGSVTQTGPFTLTLTGANTFSGGFTIDRGTVLVAKDANLGAASSTVSLGDGTLETTASFSIGRNIVLTDYGLIQTDSGTNLIIAGAISGNGSFTKAGFGTLTLTGANTWTGGVGIVAGTMQATQPLPGNVGVGSSGTLDGVPEVDGNLSNSGKVAVHGGNGSDTTVGGNYTQTSTGTLAVSLGSKLAVTGLATIDGRLEITGADSGYAANMHTDVLTAAGGVIGTFASLVKDSGVVFTSSTIQYGANEVWLDTTGLSVTVAAAGGAVHYTPASMGSAVRVQGAFEALDAKIEKGNLDAVSGDFVKSAGEFQQAPTLRAAQDSLESLSGQLYAASAGMTLQAIDATSRALSARLEDLAAYRGPQHTWARQLDLSGDMARSGYGNVNYQINGWLAGTDMRLGPHALAGFALSQGNGFEQLAGRFDRNRSQSAEAMAYAGWTQGRWYANGRVGLGHYHQYMDRMLLLGTHYQGVGTDFAGRYNVAYGEGGLHFGLGTLQLTPFADLEYDRVLRDGFVEQGAGGFGLKADAQTISRSLGGAGFKLARAWRFDADRSLSVDARVQWRRTLGSSGTVFDASLVGMDEWRPLTGVGLSRNSRVFGLDLNANLSAHTRFALGGDYVDGDRGRAIAATANFTVAF